MSEKVCNVLFICTGNSARSTLADGLMHHLGAWRFKAWSAGRHPNGAVNPFALQTLATWRMPTNGFRSKGRDEFALPGAPALDFAFTVCGNAAGEVGPVWPSQPMTAHWGVPDPAAVEGTGAQKSKAFKNTAITLKRRIERMLSLPLNALVSMSLQRQIDQIGKTGA